MLKRLKRYEIIAIFGKRSYVIASPWGSKLSDQS